MPMPLLFVWAFCLLQPRATGFPRASPLPVARSLSSANWHTKSQTAHLCVSAVRGLSRQSVFRRLCRISLVALTREHWVIPARVAAAGGMRREGKLMIGRRGLVSVATAGQTVQSQLGSCLTAIFQSSVLLTVATKKCIVFKAADELKLNFIILFC